MVNHRKGRPTKPAFITTWGETIDGAYLGTDGRLRPIGRSSPAFGGEERVAVNKFRRWQQEQQAEDGARSSAEVDAMTDAERQRWLSAGRIRADRDGWPLEGDVTGVVAAVMHERERIRDLILSDPPQAAIELRIPHLAHYPTEPVKPQFKLAELAEFFTTNARNDQGKPIHKKYRENVERAWTDFCEVVNVPYARDIRQAHIESYRQAVMAEFDKEEWSPAWVATRYKAIQRIFSFALERCDEADKPELRRVLDLCISLRPPTSENNPAPISPEHFNALLEAAGVREKAILLTCLNACMHSGEACSTREHPALLKTEIDLDAGTLVARRSKTRNPRVAKLWPRTIEAIRSYLKARPNQSPYLFPLDPENFRQILVRLRRKLKLPDYVTSEGLRDAAYTIAEETDAHHAKFLGGHKTGMSDKYVLRQATNSKVVACCQAIEERFFAGK